MTGGARRGAAVVSVAGFVLFWQALALLKADASVLPSPAAVAAIALAEASDGALFTHVGATLARVAAAFALAMGIGAALGLALGRSRVANRWLDAWLVIFLNLPALVVIVLAYLWIGLNEVAAIAAVAINKIPVVAVTVREGARALDPALDDLTRVFRFSRRDRLLHVIAPQLAPYFAASARSGLSIIWKIVLVVEFLGRPDGVGFQIHLYFQLFEVGHVLAYALSFMAVMMAVDFGLIQPAERRAAAWRAR